MEKYIELLRIIKEQNYKGTKWMDDISVRLL